MSARFDERRRLSLNEKPAGLGPVLYVMAREQRIEDNWALIAAAAAAKERSVELLILFPLAPMFNHGQGRHNYWMVDSLKEVAETALGYQIPFYIEYGNWVDSIPDFVLKHHVGEVVFDFNPLEPVRAWRENVAKKISVKASVVDARNIVPSFFVSNKCEFSAATFRPKIHKWLKEFLVPFPRLQTVLPAVGSKRQPAIDWDRVSSYRATVPDEALEKNWRAGHKAGMKQVDKFIRETLPNYDTLRNDPTKDGVSNLSPYLRWGNISAAKVAMLVEKADAPKAHKDSFLEELIVRRELSDNYCFYTKDHTKLAAAHPWAQKTLAEHKNDEREYLYTYKEFAAGRTHDPLWNAAQKQMLKEGKMHGYMRMYWAKKILEWTPDPQTAIDIALRLNDSYELDGRDSNGVVGVMWSIAGVHDRAWTERPIFGKIRYMNYNGCKRKFAVKEYEERYGGNIDHKLF